MKSSKVELTLPIQVIQTTHYNTAILDGDGKYHYFDNNGNYDGWSRDCIEPSETA